MMDSQTGERAYRTMQELATQFANGQLEVGEGTDAVTKRDALDALVQVFAVLDQPLAGNELTLQMVMNAMAFLVTLWDHIATAPTDGDGTLTRDEIAELVEELRANRP